MWCEYFGLWQPTVVGRITTSIYWQITRKRRPSYPALPLSATVNGPTVAALRQPGVEEAAMMEPKFDFTARLADLIDAARDPVMAIGGPLSDEGIIAALEEAIEALREGLL